MVLCEKGIRKKAKRKDPLREDLKDMKTQAKEEIQKALPTDSSWL